MAEQNEDNKYIKCSKCRCKYHNNDNNIKEYFGYTRLNERYKTCVKCREKVSRQNVYINCELCGLIISKHSLKKHQETTKCMDWDAIKNGALSQLILEPYPRNLVVIDKHFPSMD